MKELKLSLDVGGINIGEEDKKKNPSEIVTTVIKNVCLTWAQSKRGMAGEDRKLYYKMCDVFDVAVKEKADSVSLDDNVIGFIRKAFREATLVPDVLLRKIEDLVDAIKDR